MSTASDLFMKTVRLRFRNAVGTTPSGEEVNLGELTFTVIGVGGPDENSNVVHIVPTKGHPGYGWDVMVDDVEEVSI